MKGDHPSFFSFNLSAVCFSGEQCGPLVSCLGWYFSLLLKCYIHFMSFVKWFQIPVHNMMILNLNCCIDGYDITTRLFVWCKITHWFFNHDQHKRDCNDRYELILTGISIQLFLWNICYPLQRVISLSTPEKSVQDEALDEDAIKGWLPQQGLVCPAIKAVIISS